MSHLELWEKVRKVPQEATKPITGGRLNGKTDINPVWRLKTLTEQFGVCGIGWKYSITDKRLEKSTTDEIKAFVDIELFIKVDGQWSEAIPGTGGSSFVEKESKGLYTSDECFKMALTDAISVACKALGIGADIYWDKDASKYDKQHAEDSNQAKTTESKDVITIEKLAKAQPAKVFLAEGDALIGPHDYKTLVMLVADPTGKAADPAKHATMMAIVTKYGYASLKEVKNRDYQKIYADFESTQLPEVLQ